MQKEKTIKIWLLIQKWCIFFQPRMCFMVLRKPFRGSKKKISEQIDLHLENENEMFKINIETFVFFSFVFFTFVRREILGETLIFGKQICPLISVRELPVFREIICMRIWPTFCRGKRICPLIRGVRLLECPLNRGFTVTKLILNKTHMCVNYLAYVEYGTHLPV